MVMMLMLMRIMMDEVHALVGLAVPLDQVDDECTQQCSAFLLLPCSCAGWCPLMCWTVEAWCQRTALRLSSACSCVSYSLLEPLHCPCVAGCLQCCAVAARRYSPQGCSNPQLGQSCCCSSACSSGWWEFVCVSVCVCVT